MADTNIKPFDLNRVKLGNNVGLHSLFYHLEELVKWEKGEYFAPLFVDISPTSRCNQDCPFCFTEWLRAKPKTIPGDLLIKIFGDMAEAGVKTCEIQGSGEPFLNPAVPDAIVTGGSGGMNICVVSNGVLLNQEILKKIMQYVSFFRISNLEPTPELYARTHGCAESQFRRAVYALEEAVRIRCSEGLNTVVTATVIVFYYNAPYVVDTVRMLKNIGVDVVHVKSPGIMQHNKEHNWQTDTYDKFKDKFEEAKSLEDDDFKVNIRCDYFDFHDGKIDRSYKKCYGVEFAVHISSGAKIYPCYTYWEDERYCLGDLNRQSFRDIWAGDERKEVMKRFYEEVDPDDCKFHCKQHSPNEVLWELANPPIHARTF
jgi:GTP 3',8-cyclase